MTSMHRMNEHYKKSLLSIVHAYVLLICILFALML